MADAGVVVASKPYRKVVNKFAEALRVDPNHTQTPSEDFRDMLALMDQKSRERAVEWYRRGLRRGFDEATTAVAEGKIKFKDGTLVCPGKVVLTCKIRFRGLKPKAQEFEFTADELGFE